MSPKLSIIMPVYKSEQHIQKSIVSILNQDYQDYELILINDGSPDQSGIICDKYAKLDSRIKVIYQENQGVSGARNKGIEVSKGEFVTFIDSDDSIDESAYKLCMQSIEEFNVDMLIFGMIFQYYRENQIVREIEESFTKSFVLEKYMLKDYFLSLYETNYLSSVCNKIIKRTLIIDNNIFFNNRIVILEDFEFSLNVIEKSNKLFVEKYPFYKYSIDVKINGLQKRPNIDYWYNFEKLNATLLRVTHNLGVSNNIELSLIHGICFRNYLLILEKLFCESISFKEKHKFIKKFIQHKEIQILANKSQVKGKKLKLILTLVKKQWDIFLAILFQVNYSYNTLKRR